MCNIRQLVVMWNFNNRIAPNTCIIKQQANTIDYIHQGIIVGVGMCPLIGGGLTPIGIG